MAGYQDLFTDPMAAIGYGLLTSRQNPLGEGLKLLQSAEAAKSARDLENEDRKYKRSLLEYKLNKPNVQYMADPSGSGRVFAVDKNTGTVSYAPFSGGDASPIDSTPSGGNPAPQSNIPPVLSGNPAATQKYLNKKAEEEAKKPSQTQATAALEGGVAKTESLNSIIDAVKAKAGKSNFVTGGIGSLMKEVPGTLAHDISNDLDTIKANIGFDRLQQMRDSSKTGGALGNVSDNENKMLQKTLSSLEQSQSHEQFLRNLDRVKEQYAKSTERLKKAYLQDYGTLEGFDFGDSGTTAAHPAQTQDFGGFKILGIE